VRKERERASSIEGKKTGGRYILQVDPQYRGLGDGEEQERAGRLQSKTTHSVWRIQAVNRPKNSKVVSATYLTRFIFLYSAVQKVSVAFDDWVTKGL